jgi:hypothetical protein
MNLGLQSLRVRKSSVLSDIVPCSLPKIKQIESRAFSACNLLHFGFLLGSFFYPDDGGNMFLLNVG